VNQISPTELLKKTSEMHKYFDSHGIDKKSWIEFENFKTICDQITNYIAKHELEKKEDEKILPEIENL
jgi:hypothetical protein